MTAASSLMLSPFNAGDVSILHIACTQGRFSGRLQSKSDEAALLDECPQLGPLLGGSLDSEVRSMHRKRNLVLSALQHTYMKSSVKRTVCIATHLQARSCC